MTDFTRDWIAKREQLEKAATEGPWYDMEGVDWVARVVGGGMEVADTGKADDAKFIAAARTSLPAATAALRVVVELHKPDDEDMCWSCYGVAHPCLTVAAIEAELRSES